MTDSQSRWQEAKRLFDDAVAQDESQREAWLRQACEGDPELLAEVQSLLAWHRESTGFLETPAARVADLPLTGFADPLGETRADPRGEPPQGEPPLGERLPGRLSGPPIGLALGQSLGPWRIIDVIGRGGMGVVYRAERADAAFRRQAAIKVVRFGPGSAHIIERFQRERETLAALDHPNIARLMDGGTTPDGQPYFVMELVDGIPVDRYCDEHRLTIEQRLDLFRTICAGVQYAHENLVVHRDIKPDNILVTRDGTSKLLDFGIATIISRDAQDQRARAGDEEQPAAASWLMTPDFASPEQVSGRPIVTTASDVYSLGVLLYVLLTGTRPYHLTGTTPADVQDQLREATLVRPSERVRAAAGAADAVERAARRGTTPRQLSKRLAGDLDAIVLRALGRDPTARYSTVERLANDLECHRIGHPVSARGRDAAYRAQKFIRRHGVALAVIAGVALLTVAGVAGVLWQAAIAAEARTRAERRFDDVRRLARSFMFDVHDSMVNVPGTTASRALMVRTAVQYLDSLAREAAGDYGLQRELANAFVKVGDAQGHPTSPNVGDTAGALASYRRAITIADTVRVATPGDLEAERTLAMAHRRLADVLAWTGDTSSALRHCQQSGRLFAEIAARKSPTLDDRVQAGIAEIKLGDLLGNPNFPNLGRPAEASVRYDQALGVFRQLSTSAPTDQGVRRYLGLTLERIGTLHEHAQRWPQATDAYTQSFDIRQSLAAAASSHTDIQRDYAIAFEKLGNVDRFTGNLRSAAVRYRGALAQFERLARADPSNRNAARTVAISREKLGQMLAQSAGALADTSDSGAASSQSASTDARASRTPANPVIPPPRLTAADLKQVDEAVDLLRAALTTHRTIATGDPENAQARCDTARVAEILGDTLDARSSRAASSRPPSSSASPESRANAGLSACGNWRESARTRESLGTTGRRSVCATDEDLARLAAKLRACR